MGMLYASLNRGTQPQPLAAPDRVVTIDPSDRTRVEQAEPAARPPLTHEQRPAESIVEHANSEPTEDRAAPRTEEILPTEGTVVTTPPEREAPAASSPAASSPRLIDINSATQAQLELLPRIGPALAQRIIEERTRNGPFRSLRDLERVRGIGEKTVEALSPYAECKQPR